MIKRINTKKRIASVGYDSRLKYFGGAPAAAIAFKRWAVECGYGCDLITFTGSGFAYDDSLSKIWDIEYQCKRWDDFGKVLNRYDMIYFSSPMGIAYKREEQGFYVEKYATLEKPFIINIHGEYDERYYDLDKVKQILSMDTCFGLAVVYDTGYWNHLVEDNDKPVFSFYPCTIPDYALKDIDTVGDLFMAHPNRRGILYAHRFASVKRPHQLAKMTLDDSMMRRMDNNISVYGASTGMYLMWERDVIAPIGPIWNRHDCYHNIYDVKSMERLYGQHRYFWDVSGSSKTKYVMKRLNLSGVEALSRGCLPFINKDYCPDEIKDIAVLVDIDEDIDWSLVAARVDEIDNDYWAFLRLAKYTILNSSLSYDSVKTKVMKIIMEGL